ncbi:MAG: hypoxanthine phosphoribosyltransferase [Bacteroidales bacterium]|jgi:hypoxanthine phosphoribosyltransferase|nr:hypoxanthine phosphoribosyltransferase [Bacteroidales bacterium]
MERVTLHDKTFRKFIMGSRIKEAIDEVAERINADFEGCTDVPVVICTLNGALPFTGELFMRLKFNCELGSVKLSSYRGTQTTGTVLTVQGLSEDVRGKRVIACEDIVDTGNTILALRELLLANGATEVRICTMLLKPDVYDKDVKLDYVGMEIPNDFIVGCGLDYNGLGRNLRDIYVLDK